MEENEIYDYNTQKVSYTPEAGEQEQKKALRRAKNKGILIGALATTFICLILCLVFLLIDSFYYGGGLRKTADSGDGFALSEEADDKIALIGDLVKDYFYLDEVTDSQLEEGIYKGMIESLGDIYSEYYTAEELTALMQDTEGVYYGIGAYVSMDTVTTLPKIASVIAGAPAETADLRPDDIIYAVDGTETYGMELEEVVSMIKGPEGTEVVLTIVRSGERDYLEVPVVRAKVESPTVKYEMLDDEKGYIAISEFDDVTADQFADALATLKGNDMKGLIIDLRANPGGNLDTVVRIAKMILPEGIIVYTEDKAGNRVDYKCDGTKELDVPLVVLVDGNSASASEILAGAIKDYEKGTLVGTTTYGKGIVQQIVPLSDGSAVKITVSAYYTPNGVNIHGTGIEPDVEIDFDSEAYYDSEDPVDNQLEKAKEVLAGYIK
ncbi:MAG: S41 family peptidase [Acetatifactor sp.]|nr:S41 family peptidase [Acetatifactor sp.]